MAPPNLQHRRTHNLLLVAKLLSQRDAVSPFTLVLDSLEQSGKPLVVEFIKRATVAKVRIIYVSFETLRKPQHVDAFVAAWSQSSTAWQKEVREKLKTDPSPRKILIFDSLNSLAASDPTSLAALLSSFINPTISLLAVYHTDIPIPSAPLGPYGPSPLTLLKYIATTIFTIQCWHHVLARKAARDRSHVEPSFGLEEEVEGIVQGPGANGTDGIVLEMEHRRRSGRGVRECYFMPLRQATSSGNLPNSDRSREAVMLLEDHPLYRSPEEDAKTAEAETDITFELGLTAKQRQDREGVVLPYFDAQKGGGEGGRILYDMGSEDDFDEEEDEI